MAVIPSSVVLQRRSERLEEFPRDRQSLGWQKTPSGIISSRLGKTLCGIETHFKIETHFAVFAVRCLPSSHVT